MSGLKYTENDTKNLNIRNQFKNQYDVPLQNTTITGNITDCFGQINVKQSYLNTNKNTIEAVYLFPLKNTSSITDLQVTFGSGKKLIGDFQRKDLAKKTYNEAIQSSKKACILEKANDSYQISIGNIEANESVIVEYTYIITLDILDDAFKFVFQTNIAPKYCPITNITTKELNDPTNKLDYSNNITHTFDLTLNCTSQNKINNITSFSHSANLTIIKQSDNNWTVSTNVSPKQGDLNIFIHTEIKPTLYYQIQPSQTSANTDYVYSALLHQINSVDKTIPNAEYVVLLDRSGSMDVEYRIGLARKALSKFVDDLPIDTYFNIVSFGTNHTLMFPNSEKMTPENKLKCKNTIQTFRADMGGTEVYKPVDVVIKMGFQNEITERNIILITDGDVGNSVSIKKLVKSANSNIRFFTIGVGKDVSRSLVEGIAESGNGTAIFVNDNTIDDCITKILDCSTKQYYKNINVDWGTTACIETSKINVIYPNKPFIMFSKMPFSAFNKDSTIKITADNGKSNEKATWTLSYNNNVNITMNNINQHYARRLLIDIEEGKSFYHAIGTDVDDIVLKATQLSIENKIVSNYVSLVLVSDEKTKTTEEMVSVKVPHFARCGPNGGQESEIIPQSFGLPMSNLHNQCEMIDSIDVSERCVKESVRRTEQESAKRSTSFDPWRLPSKGPSISPCSSSSQDVSKGGSSFSIPSLNIVDGCKSIISGVKNYFKDDSNEVIDNAYIGNGVFNMSAKLLKIISAPKQDIINVIVNKGNFTETIFYHLLIWKYLIDKKDKKYVNDVFRYIFANFKTSNVMTKIWCNIESLTVKDIIDVLSY
jgi:hypothetical protein